MDRVQAFKEWFFRLSEQYGVNPIVFGAIYVGAIPFFFLSLGWTVRNIRQGKAATLPVLCTGFFFISAYLYLLFAGRNIPAWVYGVLFLLIGYALYSLREKIRKKRNGMR